MLLLIALAHAPLFLAATERSVLYRPAGGSPLDEAMTFLGLVLVDNRAYPLFALLLGYGMARMIGHQISSGLAEPVARRLLRRRGWFLLMFGLFNAVLIHAADILGPYGLLILLVGWVTLATDRRLWQVIAASALVYLATVPAMAFFMEFVAHPSMAEDGSVFTMESYTTGAIIRLFSWPIGVFLTIAGYPLITVALLGVWAARKGILDDPEQHRRFLVCTALAGLTISLGGALPLTAVAMDWWSMDRTTTGWLTSLHIITGVAGGLAYAAMFGLVCMGRSGAGNWFAQTLAAAGRRSLTCYLLQALILAFLLSPPLLGLGGTIHAAGAVAAGILAWAVAVGVCRILHEFDRAGPADALLRRLVYRPVTG